MKSITIFIPDSFSADLQEEIMDVTENTIFDDIMILFDSSTDNLLTFKCDESTKDIVNQYFQDFTFSFV